jgi:hypothetical protein
LGELGTQIGSSIHDLVCCYAGANALAPDLMSAEQRLTEVGQILAAGFLRLRQRQSISVAAPCEDFQVDFAPDRSVDAAARQRRHVGR